MHAEATRKLFTVDEYHRMATAGIFTEDDRVELIEGEVIEMSPIGLRHAAAVDRTARQFMPLAIENKVIVRVQNPMRLDSYNEPLPDITLLAPRPDFYVTHHPGPEEVLPALEVADTSLSYDRDVKIPTYAARGIRESWIEDLVNDVILVFRDPGLNGYKTALTFRHGDSLSPLAFPEFVMTVDQILEGAGR